MLFCAGLPFVLLATHVAAQSWAEFRSEPTWFHDVSCRSGVRLGQRTVGTSDPAQYEAVLFDGRRVLTVSKLADLAGWMHISTADQALRFVRLATSPYIPLSTGRKRLELEAMPFAIFERATGYGQTEDAGPGPFVRDGFCAQLSNRTSRRLLRRLPSVRRTPAGFVIRRILVSFSQHPPAPFLVTEMVVTDGSYRISERKSMQARGWKVIDWFYPYRE